jgi:arylsulfatase A-like enzyme
MAAITGLGWGLGLGVVDGLAALLEGDPTADLGRRLLTVLYVAVFDALVFGLALAVVGGLVWAIQRLTRRQAGQSSLLGLYAGLCAALSMAAYGLTYPQESSRLVIAVLALAAGGIVGWLVRAAAGPAQTGTSTPGRRLTRIVLVALGAGVLILAGTVVYRHTIRDLPALNPRITDQTPTPERPNIVLVSIDALRADGLGIYGNDLATSPHIDDLARKGLVFGQALSQASSTVPAVASFMTSLYPTELGIIAGNKWAVDEMRVTLAEVLQVAGYRTQAYITNGNLVPGKGYDQGFDDYVAPDPGQPYGIDRLRAETLLAGLACRQDGLLCDLFSGGYKLLFDRLLVMQNEGGRVNDLARRFIRLHSDEQFFLWLHYMEPHAAYSPQQTLVSLPDSVDKDRQAFLRSWTPANNSFPMVIRRDDHLAVEAFYDGEVLDADGWVAGIWDEIQAQGLADRTLLVITADHGEEFDDHGDYGHGHTVYQELTWVPLIFVGTQVRVPGRIVDTPVPMLDLMPTLLDVARAPLPEPVHGQSLLPVLQGDEPPSRPIYSESPARRSSYDDKALRLDGYKLVYNVTTDQAELYDLRQDPEERNDLSKVEAGRAAAMRDDLRTWTAGTLNTWAALPQSGKEAEEVDAALQDALRQIGY